MLRVTMAVFAALLAVPSGAQTLTDELLQLEAERTQAYANGDEATLERHFAPEYSHTNLRGDVTDRQQELAFYRPESFRLESGSIDDVTVHDYGETAVLLGTVEWIGATFLPNPNVEIDLSGRFRVTRVYVRRDERWQLTVSHASQIPDAAVAEQR